MFINIDSIKNNKEETILYDGELSIYSKLNHSSIIKDIKEVSGKINLIKVNNILSLEFDLTSKLLIESAYTLKEIDYILPIKDTLYFTNEIDLESEEVFFVKSKVDLEETIYSLIITLLPLNAHGENEVLPSNDEFKVYSEDELELENEENHDSPFDVLKDLDL